MILGSKFPRRVLPEHPIALRLLLLVAVDFGEVLLPSKPTRFRAKREHFKRFYGHLLEIQDPNLALTILSLPYSLDSG